MTEEKQVRKESAKALTDEMKEFVLTSPLNLMPGEDGMPIFYRPLVKFADGDDSLFTEYKTIIAPTHMTPREVLALATGKSPEDLGEKISVISWVLPVHQATRKSNRKESELPSRLWSHTRWFGEKLNDAFRRYVVDILNERGYLAVAPAIPPFLKMESNEKGPFSNWSERHIAFAAGQGSFSLSDGFITEKGIAHRCGSVVTDMPLPVTERTLTSPYANCLFYFDGSCGKCIGRCPAGAISEKGHDKVKCGKYLGEIGYAAVTRSGEYDLETSVAGCGLCQTGVPCEKGVPGRILRSRGA